MSENFTTPRQALNKAFLKVKPTRSGMEIFKKNLVYLLNGLDETESEEHHKNDLGIFLRNTFYRPAYYINTKDRTDFVIHNGADAKSKPGVLVEVKKPGNKVEMVRKTDLKAKAFYELILYYLRERITNGNLEIKHLIATNVFEWFIFDAAWFEKMFAQNKAFVKQFTDFEEGRLSGITTDFFYNSIAEPYVKGIEGEMPFTWFDLRGYEKPLRNADKTDDLKLITLYKVLSPEHLLKLPFANDSNTLDKSFYSELLHIIGLMETKSGSKKIIERKIEGHRDPGSFLENTILQLDSRDKISRLPNPAFYGESHNERLFNVSLELVITWINRILFLKLLEAQLVQYHRGETGYGFLNIGRIGGFDDLDNLFFRVLARKPAERDPEMLRLFSKVPYLNSSLFEPTDLEHQTIFISNLQDHALIPIISSTVLKDCNGKRRTGYLSGLQYLFEFLDAYDFAGEGSMDIQEDNKTLINASVLGLIFEKLNGYKDGSFFTPGFITMYMCRETIRHAAVQKFNETKGWNCEDLNQVYDKIEDRKEANQIINSLKICDPAVGSGHFLVSALNEIIAVKNDLKILCDRTGKRLKEYHVEVANDELVITDEEGDFFRYSPSNAESRRVQEAIFHEKKTIIENCLFGVDINPNSVKICRLRLWIELLKNAYYKNISPSHHFTNSPSELETLPNIDINIKCGNSLISRYPLDADVRQVLKKYKWSIDSYRIAVMTYRNARTREEKREMEKLISRIKQDFQTEIGRNDPLIKRIDKLANELYHRFTGNFLFEPEQEYGDDKLKAKRNVEQKKLEEEIALLKKKVEEIKVNKIFENAFEWRFEFPEVLNDDGDFVGFDVVIGNPPYGMISNEFIKNFIGDSYVTVEGRIDLFESFIEKGLKLICTQAELSYIIPSTFLSNLYSKKLRKFLVENFSIFEITNFGMNVFEDPIVHSCIIRVLKGITHDKIRIRKKVSDQTELQEDYDFHIDVNTIIENPNTTFNITLNKKERDIFSKLNNHKKLSDYCYIRQCIKTGNDEDYVRKSNEEPGALWKPSLRGKGVQRYCIIENDVFLKYGEWLARNWKNTDFYERHKIAIRETGKRITASIDFNNRYFLSSLYAVYPKQNYYDDELLFLLGILNSNLATFIIAKISYELTEGAFTKFRTNQLGRLPIIVDNDNCKQAIILIVTQILSIKKNDPAADTSDLESEIDRLVYELYGLTEEEIRIVEGQ